MTYSQTFYTSCSVGLRGGRGFQINAATHAMEGPVLEAVERLGVYVPPLSSPTRPTPQEIEQFPVSLFFCKLPTGHVVLGQSKYIGTDYSGRYGNYFSHCLVGPTDAMDPDFIPIELWQSRIWNTRESTLQVLPTIDRPEVGAFVDPLRINEFLQDRDRLTHFGGLLTAVENSLVTGRRIIIVDDNESIALWIAAVSYALPDHLAWALTFNTYAKNPYQADVLIVGTTTDSDFAFSPHEIDHRYFVFDFAGQRFSRVTLSSFARNATEAYASNKAEEVARFGRFIHQVSPDLPASNLPVAFGFYALVHALPREGVGEAALLEWCAPILNRLPIESIRSMAAAIQQSRLLTPELIASYSDLYKSVTSGGVHADVRDAVERAYLNFIVQRSDNIPADTLICIADDIVLSPTSKSAGQALRGTWFDKVRGTQDSIRLCGLFTLGAHLGVLSDSRDIVSRLAETVIGPALREAGVQRAVLGRLPTPIGDDIMSGIAAHLQANASDARLFQSLRSFTTGTGVLRCLEERALHQGAIELYYRLVGEEAVARPDQHIDFFRRCLAAPHRFRTELTPSRVELAYNAVWQESIPTRREALLIIESVPEPLLAKTSIPERLGNVLVTNSDLKRDDAERDSLSERLRSGGLWPSLGDARYIVECCRIASGLREHNTDLTALIRAAIQVAVHLPDRTKSALLEMAAERAVEIQDREAHEDVLLRGNASAGKLFMTAYSRSAAAHLSRGRSPDPRAVGVLFSIWVKAAKSLGEEQSRVLLEHVLRRAVKNWGENEFQFARSSVGIDAGVDAAWMQWSRRSGRRLPSRPGALWRLLRWFVILIGIAIGLIAGTMLARRLFGPMHRDTDPVAPAAHPEGTTAPEPKGEQGASSDRGNFPKPAVKRRPGK